MPWGKKEEKEKKRSQWKMAQIAVYSVVVAYLSYFQFSIPTDLAEDIEFHVHLFD